MSAWVYLLSKFTDEALLLEGAAGCLLIAILAGIWILRRARKEEALIPASVVKDYLQGIAHGTQTLHENLFGDDPGFKNAKLPSQFSLPPQGTGAVAAGAPTSVPQSAASAKLGGIDPQVLALETKLAEQLRQIQTLSLQKSQLEKDLSAASTAAQTPDGASASPAPGGGAPTSNPELEKKLHELEARLIEYSVIEDDLANLKRLQQENQKLKAQVESMTGKPVPPMPEEETPKESKSKPEGKETPAAKQAASPEPAAGAAAKAETKPAAAPTPAAEAAPKAPAPPEAQAAKAEPAKAPAAQAAEKTPDPGPAKTAAPEATAPAQPAANKTPVQAPAPAAPPKTETAPASAQASPGSVQAAPGSAQVSTQSIEPAAPPSDLPPVKNDDELIAEFEKMLSS